MCSNCKDPHASSAKDCPVWQKRKSFSVYAFTQRHLVTTACGHIGMYPCAIRKSETDFNNGHFVSESHPCGDEWRGYGDRCYFFYTELRTWYDAKSDCEDRASHLVIIRDLNDHNAIVGKLSATKQIIIVFLFYG